MSLKYFIVLLVICAFVVEAAVKQRRVPDDKFKTTQGKNNGRKPRRPTTTVPNMATMFVPDKHFVTTPGVEVPKTTVPNMATMFVPEKHFVSTPGVEVPTTTVPNVATMFVPDKNFVTSPGIEVTNVATDPNMATKFVPESNFITSPGKEVPKTTVHNVATMFVPEGNFVTSRGIEAPNTTPVGSDAARNVAETMAQTILQPTDINAVLTEQAPIVHETTTNFVIQTNPQPLEVIPEFQIAPTMFYITAPNVGIIPNIHPAFAMTEPTQPQIVTQHMEAAIAEIDFHTTPAVELLEIGELIPVTPEMYFLTNPPELNSVTYHTQAEPNKALTEFQTTAAHIQNRVREVTQAVEILSNPSDIEMAFGISPQPQSESGISTRGSEAQDVARNAEGTPAPNIPIVYSGTTTQTPVGEPMADNTLFDAQSMNSNSLGQIEISDNSSISENHPVISTQQIPSTTTTSGLQHHQLGSLLETVLVDYYPQFRPRNDQSRFVAIFTAFVPISIIEFNTQEQKFSVMGYFKMDWRDDFLTWNPSDYEDTEILRISVKSIWTPKLVINKAYDGEGLVGDTETDIALINYRGYVRWFPEGIYSVVCKVTIQFYPFDKQTCVLTYFIADEDNSTINLKHVGDVDLTEYIENAEWKLTNLTVERKQTDNIYVVNYQFNVERRGGFAMFTLVVPILMLSVLSGTTFLVPIESGEKCSFSVSVFLAYGIFETIVIDTLPHNSLDVSYFIIYLTSLLIVSVILTFYTIVQAKIFDSIGTRHFGAICKLGSSPDSPTSTWGGFLQKLDNYVFVAFLLVVAGLTSIFFSVMGEKFDFL